MIGSLGTTSLNNEHTSKPRGSPGINDKPGITAGTTMAYMINNVPTTSIELIILYHDIPQLHLETVLILVWASIASWSRVTLLHGLSESPDDALAGLQHSG